MGKCKEKVDSFIGEILQSHSGSRFWKAVAHQMETGGKRLRPVFLFLSCNILGGEEDKATHAAAAVEIMHNYTLIVDDVIDHSDTRRGRPTVWKAYGQSIAECIGAHYSASVFEAVSHSPNPVRMVRIMSDAMKAVVEGEIIDILQERYGREEEPFVKENRYKDVFLEDYIDMAGRKTAKMFEASCVAGGVCAGGSEEEIEALRSYGYNLGISFQISDDILDIFGEEEKFGKKIGKDIEERKGGNVVLLFALSKLGSKDKKTLENILKKNIIGEGDIEEAVEIIKNSKALEEARSLSERYIKKAKESLYLLPDNEWRKMMEDLANYITNREK